MIWNKYEKGKRIGYGSYSNVYKAKNKETGNYVAIKEIDKEKFQSSSKSYFMESDIMVKINTENSIKLIETIDTPDFYYIIMELCICNLEDCLKIRENPFSTNELRDILLQLNNTFKILQKKNIVHSDLKPSNLLISLDKIDKCLIKLSDYGSSNIINNNISYGGTPITMAPEVLKGEFYTEKSDIWSLGIIIYYMIFRDYPYHGKNELILYDDIISGKKINSANDNELNDLIQKMLKINPNERMSWNEYFSHSFFKEKSQIINFPEFNINCKMHSKQICYYCKECKSNLCEKCFNEHSSKVHQIVSVSKIGLNDKEIQEMNILFKEIEKASDYLEKTKKEIESLLNQIKINKENSSIYDNDDSNNFKQYYFQCLRVIKQHLEIESKVNYLDLDINNNTNYILCEYDIPRDKVNKEVQIINKGVNNQKEIKESCILYYKEKKLNFCEKYKFPKPGKNIIKIIFKKPITNSSWLFYKCSYIISIDLSHFNSINITSMYCMFNSCSALKSLNLTNFNTSNVEDMSSMFLNCSSLESLNLSTFDTSNVNNMGDMFGSCSSLIDLDLSSFDTYNVTCLGGMFYNCTSLKSLNLINFKTDNVTKIWGMFDNCTSLQFLDISNFNISNVTNIKNIFKDISKSCKILTQNNDLIKIFKESGK